MRSSRFCLLLLALLLVVSLAWPQGSNSTVHGTVRDQAHAVIPGAAVTLTNTATNVARTTTTNDSGLYAFPGVTPGPYRIVADFSGMQRFEGTLTVQVQQDAVVDVAMQVGQTTSQVEVLDVTPIVQVDSPSLGQVLERRRIEQLPISGRGFQALLLAVPGIVWSTHGHGIGGRMQGAGMPDGSNMVVFDGAPMNEVVDTGNSVARPPSLDAIEEMHMEVNNASAKFSRPTTVVLSSKSGTNTIHGALFATNRNSAIGVARQRQDSNDKPPYLNRNEYGVSAGGPVYVPKLYNGRNRTFWFWAWEGTRFWTYTTIRTGVPTEAMRNGDFRGLVDSQGRQMVLYDPLTTDSRTWLRAPLSYRGVANTVDPARMSPMAKYIIDRTKLPTLPINPLLDSNWVGPSLRLLEQDSYTLRLDHRFSEKNLVYGRYTYGTHYEEYAVNGQPATFEPIGGRKVIGMTNRWRPNYSVSTTWLHTFSPTLTNELLLTGTREYQWRGAGDKVTDYAKQMGLPNPLGATNWPTFSSLDLPGYTVDGESPYYQVYNFLTLQNNATKIIGKHEFQFGGHLRWEDIMRSLISTSGSYSASTLGTALYDTSSTATNPIARPQTGYGLANFYLGVMNYGTNFRRPSVRLRRTEYAPYFQDNWKLTSRLTLNLGLRYEFRTPIKDLHDLTTSFDFEKRAYVIGTDLDTFIRRGGSLPAVVQKFQEFGGKIISYKDAGLPQGLVYANHRNFGPRLGFAYRALDGRKAFVVRGGYRISYYTELVENWVSTQSSPQITGTSFQYTVSSTASSPDGLPNYGLRTAPTYIAGVNTPDSLVSLNDARLLTRGFTAIQVDPHLVDPRIRDWNLTVEKEVMPNTAVRITYVGNSSRNSQQTAALNDSTPSYIWYATKRLPLPTGEFASVATRPYDQQVYGTVNRYATTGYSNYNGLHIELERRYSKGVAYQIFWALNNTLRASGTLQEVNQFLPGAVPSDIDARNRFLNYRRETTWPKQQIRWNWIADLPFGKGRRFLGNASRLADKLIGGWQIAGTGSFQSSYWSLPTSIYPTTGNPIEIYGYKYPIQDCTSGICNPGYLFWNGYIPSNKINSVDASGKPNGIMGVPANYKPAGAPLIPWGQTSLPANAPANTVVSQFWDTNNVWVPLTNGSVQRLDYNDGLHPWRNQSVAGVNQWGLDGSLFKFTNLTERIVMRFNIDFFNVLNHPNNPTGIASTGILATRNSGVAARVTQLTLRLQW